MFEKEWTQAATHPCIKSTPVYYKVVRNSINSHRQQGTKGGSGNHSLCRFVPLCTILYHLVPSCAILCRLVRAWALPAPGLSTLALCRALCRKLFRKTEHQSAPGSYRELDPLSAYVRARAALSHLVPPCAILCRLVPPCATLCHLVLPCAYA